MKLEEYYAQGFEDTIKAAQQQPHPRAKAYADAERRARIAALKEQWRFPRTPQQPAQAAKPTPPKSTVG